MFFILLKYLLDKKIIPIDLTIGEYYLFIKGQNYLTIISELMIKHNNKDYIFNDINIKYKKYNDKFLYIKKIPTFTISYTYNQNNKKIKIIDSPTKNYIHLYWYALYNIPNKIDYYLISGIFTEGFYTVNKTKKIENQCCILN